MILAISSSSNVLRERHCQNVGMTLASAPRLRIQLCGATIVERDGERLEPQLPGRQGRLLFAYLVINRDHATGRDRLADALWPEPVPGSAATGLNPLLSKLRKILGPDAVEGRSSVRLRLPTDSSVDVENAAEAVHRAESKIALGEWKRAWAPSLAALLVAERTFLPGEYAPWIDEQRQLMGEIRLRALEAYATATLRTGGTELPAAVRAARTLIRLAPLRESGYQTLMEGLAAQGNVAEAIQIYGDLRVVLRDELGVDPSSASHAVYTKLIQGSG
jgi:DNA-binding SARP family transcriptional activator